MQFLFVLSLNSWNWFYFQCFFFVFDFSFSYFCSSIALLFVCSSIHFSSYIDVLPFVSLFHRMLIGSFKHNILNGSNQCIVQSFCQWQIDLSRVHTLKRTKTMSKMIMTTDGKQRANEKRSNAYNKLKTDLWACFFFHSVLLFVSIPHFLARWPSSNSTAEYRLIFFFF